MRVNSPLQETASPSTEQLEELVRCIGRILRACSIDAESFRRAVDQIVESPEAVPAARSLVATAGQHLACTDIVFYWRRDRRFLGSDGRPLKLPAFGASPSFETLCREFAAKYDTQTLMDYLVALGTVRVFGSDVELVADSVLACSSGAGNAIAPKTVLAHLKGFLGSVEFNLANASGNASDHGRFERACYASISPELIPVFQRFVEARAQNFVDAVDEWLARHRAADDDVGPTRIAGAGAYLFVHDSSKVEFRLRD